MDTNTNEDYKEWYDQLYNDNNACRIALREFGSDTWVLYKPCKYTSPTLVRVNEYQHEPDNSIRVTEYGFGETGYTIDPNKVIMYGPRKVLAERLWIWEDTNRLIESAVKRMDEANDN